MGLFAGTICMAGYLIFQNPEDIVVTDNVIVQSIPQELVGVQFDCEPDASAFDDDMLDNDSVQIDGAVDVAAEPQHASHELDIKNFVTQQERRDLFKQLGIEYLEREAFDYAPAKNIDARLTQAYLDDADNCDDVTVYYQDDIEKAALVPMSVRWLGSDVGYGVFAEADLLEDDFVGIYTGSLQDRSLVESKDYAWAQRWKAEIFHWMPV